MDRSRVGGIERATNISGYLDASLQGQDSEGSSRRRDDA